MINNISYALIFTCILFTSNSFADEVKSEQPPLTHAFTNHENMTLVIANDGPVAYRGVVSYDDAGTGQGSMLYPAPNAAGFVAALITHGLLTKSAKEKQKNKIQDAANQVLTDYQVVLEDFKYKELMEKALIKLASSTDFKLIENSQLSNNEVVIGSTPSFLITQDQKAIIIDDLLTVSFPNQSSDTTIKSQIRVVSNPFMSTESASFWTENNGENLKNLSAQLLADSIAITLKVISNTSTENLAYETVRYRQGSSEKIERAKVIEINCDRMLIKSLRGMFMSVPTSKMNEADCS